MAAKSLNGHAVLSNGHAATAKPAAAPSRARAASARSQDAQARHALQQRAAQAMFDAQWGRRRAEAAWTAALAAAVEAGVIFDHNANPEPAGTQRVVYADGAVEIAVVVLAPIAGLNVQNFIADLLAAGVKSALVKRLSARHATETKPAHRFSCSSLTA